jgi:hypothetical protein
MAYPIIYMPLNFILIFIAIFFTQPSLALVENDLIDAKLLKIQEENVVVFNRGVEDGIEVADHVQLTNSRGFVARGICLKVGMMTSYWKIYRVVNPDKVSKDDSFKIRGINSSEVEEKYTEFTEENYSEEYSDFSEAELIAWGRKRSSEKAEYDLPQDLKDDPALTEKKQSLIDRNFDAKRFAQDMKYWAITFGVNPFQYNYNRNVSKSKNLTTSVSLDNQGKKYTVNLSATQNTISKEFENIAGSSQQTVIQKTKKNTYAGTFSLRNFVPRISLTSSFQMDESYSLGQMTGETLNVNPLNLSIAIVKADSKDEESEDLWSFTISPGYQRFISYSRWSPEPQISKNYTLVLSTAINFNIGELAITLNGDWAPLINPDDPNSWDTRRIMSNGSLSLNYPLSETFNTGFTYDYNYSVLENVGPNSDQKINHVYAFNITYSKELF